MSPILPDDTTSGACVCGASAAFAAVRLLALPVRLVTRPAKLVELFAKFGDTCVQGGGTRGLLSV